MAPAPPSKSSDADGNYADVNWEELGYALTPTDFMYVTTCERGDSFGEGKLVPYGHLEISPCSGILNYGQGLFEGLKAYRSEDGRIMLFRPELNAQRMKMGAERMSMPAPSVELFVNAVKKTVLANKKWVPPPGKGSLYVRPLLLGSGPVLGVGPAPEYTLVIYATPVGSYHKGKSVVNLLVEERSHRAHSGGTGGVKSVTNYAPVMKSLVEAKSAGYSDVLFLDAATGKNVEEVSSCNIFVVKGNSVSTPAASGTILPGITRQSIIELTCELGYQVEERVLPLEDLLHAEEVFCTGTAVVVTPVGSVTLGGKTVEYKTGEGTVSQKLYTMLTGIQTGRINDDKGWTIELHPCHSK